jgi:integrase
VLDLDRDGTGRRRQKWHSGFRTKREAEKGDMALLAAHDTGTYVAPLKITLGEYQPGAGSVEMRTWTADELRRYLDHVREDRLFPAWRLAASTGLRRGELLGLRWQDVDLDAGRVSVRQTLTTVGNKVAFGEPKTARGERNIALDGVTISTVRTWRARQARERLAFGPAWHDTGLVFSRADGSLIHPDTFSFWFDRQVHAAGLPRIRFHDLRHTHATLALQAGVPAKVVSERLGHATVAFTLDVYSHVIPALQEDAAERIAALVDVSNPNVSEV